jgi:hypothetical protein
MPMSKSYCPQPRYCLEYQAVAKTDKRPLFTMDMYDKFGDGSRVTQTGVLTDQAIDELIGRLERRRSKPRESK